MKRVVIVEDEELVRRGIVMTVDWQSVDCAVVGEAADGTEGLEVIRREKPELVVTDIKMPRMDGIELLRQLRAEGNPAAVILLTAYSDFSYAQAAVKLGAVDYLLKPFHDGELEEAVRRLAGPAGAGETGEAPAGAKSRYVMEAMRYVSEHYAEPDMSIAQVAESLGLSEGHLSHVFKRETGRTLGSYITEYRIGRARELLKDCRSKVYEVAELVGYRDITYFSATFKRVAGVTPSEVQGKGKGKS